MKRKFRALALLVGVASAGCSASHNVPPSLPDAVLVPGMAGCHSVTRGDKEVWWLRGYGWDLIKTDPQSREVLAGVRVPQEYAAFDLATGFGAVWVAEGGSRPSIHKIDSKTNRPVEKIRLASLWGSKGKEAYLAIGDRAVWAAVNVMDKVFRIDPDTGAVVAAIPVGPMRLSDSLGRLAAGEGAVWVLRDRTVSRIDPETNGITAYIPVDGLFASIGRIAVGGGSVWVASGPNVTRIDPQNNRIVATFQVASDAQPAKPYEVAYMVVAKEMLWALVVSFSGSFMEPGRGHFALAEIDIKTNSVRMIRQMGTGDAGNLFAVSGPPFVVTDDEAWICLPTDFHAISIAPPE